MRDTYARTSLLIQGSENFSTDFQRIMKNWVFSIFLFPADCENRVFTRIAFLKGCSRELVEWWGVSAQVVGCVDTGEWGVSAQVVGCVGTVSGVCRHTPSTVLGRLHNYIFKICTICTNPAISFVLICIDLY